MKISQFGVLGIAILFASSVQAGVHPKNLDSTVSRSLAVPSAVIDPATTITNGTVTLGVNPEGNLIVGGIGLTYVPTSGEALAPGCACEGWGAGDAVTMDFGKAGQSFGDANITVESFTTTADTASSVVIINDGGSDLFRVTHDYSPSSSPNLYQVDVTIENLRAVDVTVRYRRAMDWDVPPTEFDELVTLITGGATNVIYSSDDGFADGNPFDGPSFIDFEGEATDSGPSDHGALFDFDFGTLAAGASDGFTIFYGASAHQSEALTALASVGAEIYSLGKANPSHPDVGFDGTPNTFIFGFAGVGGTVIGGGESIPIPSLAPLGLGLLAMLLGFFGMRRFRRI
jgi:hypothetical protein